MQDLIVQHMLRVMFDALDSQLVGIMEHNLAEVEGCLQQMGVSYKLSCVPYGFPAPPALQPVPVPAKPT